MRICLAILLFAAAQFSSTAASPGRLTFDEALRKKLLLVAAKPEYPREARERGRAGTGIFELKFDYETGHLREVHVVKTTGDRYLDARAIGALKVWQAKPRSIHNLIVPITYTQSRRYL